MFDRKKERFEIRKTFEIRKLFEIKNMFKLAEVLQDKPMKWFNDQNIMFRTTQYH